MAVADHSISTGTAAAAVAVLLSIIFVQVLHFGFVIYLMSINKIFHFLYPLRPNCKHSQKQISK